ncbi:hypothetical protein I3842_15G010600 [Carya illinoinensis]|uniref:RRM domain-containing protein n=1 Tax=Carya illinoinensis TaxID=32201 RepID=A0A922D5T0_CARIL|nr:hypothetical protein I3842_15G010600 [Carya illinoinensis]
MASSQHRRVFVGNIPYDATEEQLIDICREVGPVVSFRLVIDRETGKPKGYGFCEYKDEQTALSVCCNLQGYEINGQQLRVDFAEIDKGADRNQEQGRGGPGLAANIDPQKQSTNSVIQGEFVHCQPIGLHIAITAAAVMAGTLGGAQAGIQSNPNSLHNQSASANDPLTLHLAKMSRSQLNEIMSELKELAHRLLPARPQLPKALFQGQLMLGMVTPQLLQMPNIRLTSGQYTQPSLHDSQQGRPPAVQTLPGLPLQENQVAGVPQNSLVHSQFSAFPQPQNQFPQPTNNHIVQQATIPAQTAVSVFPAVLPPSLGNLSSRPQILAENSSSLNHHIQPPSLQRSGQVGAARIRLSFHMVNPDVDIQPSLLSHPPLSDAGFQPGPSKSLGALHAINKDADISAQVPDSGTQVHRKPIDHPQKLMKLDDGRSTAFSAGSLNATNINGSGPSQPQLPPEVESVLLQQVLNLTPEQLSSLPPEQQREVIRLQQVLRKDPIQPS